MDGEYRDSVVVYPEIGENKKGKWLRGNGIARCLSRPPAPAFPHYRRPR
jgi:hypothetical protein